MHLFLRVSKHFGAGRRLLYEHALEDGDPQSKNQRITIRTYNFSASIILTPPNEVTTPNQAKPITFTGIGAGMGPYFYKRLQIRYLQSFLEAGYPEKACRRRGNFDNFRWKHVE